MCDYLCGVFFFFKQKTAYEMRISDWSSDVCSSDLGGAEGDHRELPPGRTAAPRHRPRAGRRGGAGLRAAERRREGRLAPRHLAFGTDLAGACSEFSGLQFAVPVKKIPPTFVEEVWREAAKIGRAHV